MLFCFFIDQNEQVTYLPTQHLGTVMSGIEQIKKEAIFEEYRVLRSEIQQYHSERNNYVNYSVTLTGALLAFISAMKLLSVELSILFLLMPLLYSLLGFLYLDRSIRVIRLADYIHNYLRKQLQDVSDTDVWNWEIYKKKTTRFSKVVSLILDQIRICSFILPSVVSIAVFFIFDNEALSFLEISLIMISAISVIGMLIIAVKVQETSGAEDR